jgi:hypothetical protein
LAQAVAPDGGRAREAVAAAFTHVVQAGKPSSPRPDAVRLRTLAMTRSAASAVAPTAVVPAADAKPMEAAFRALPERWRSALWLAEVEHLSPEQTSAIVGLAPAAVALLTARARAGLRGRYVQQQLRDTTNRTCRRTLERLDGRIAGALKPGDRAKVDSHLERCETCRIAHAELADLPASLARLAVPLPVAVADVASSRWKSSLPAQAPRGRAAMAAAAIAVLAGGVAGTALYESGRARVGSVAEAAPIGGSFDSTGTSILLTPPPISSAGAPVIVSGTGGTSTGSGSTATDVARGSTAGTAAAPTASPTGSAPAPAPTPPSSGGDSGGGGSTPPPSGDGGGGSTTPPASDPADDVVVDQDVGGTDVHAGVGENDGDVNVDVEVGDAPPIHVGL